MIHFFCALHCEAEPLIHYFKLSESRQFDLFRIFKSKDETITLTITGIGKLNAASAVSYHHACLNSNPYDVWLNIGIAGHKELDIGEIRLINKITDEHDQVNWYPQLIFETPCPCISLITLDKPSTDYESSLFDMEASGFYQMASRLGTSELIHCIKIVSDNLQQPTHTVNASNVKKLITAQTEIIVAIMDLLKPIADELKSVLIPTRLYSSFTEQWHFTKSQQLQLQKLLRQWSLRFSEKCSLQFLNQEKTGKAILKALQDELNKIPFNIY